MQEAFAQALRDLARARDPRQPRRVDHDDRAQPRDRPAPAGADPAREDGDSWRRLAALESLGGDETDVSGIPDDRLRLIFTCCHPALPMDARVALTLRTLGGPHDRRDRPCVPRPRADDGPAARPREAQDPRRPAIPYRVPPAELLPERLPGVLAVLYLVFNEGYAATSGPLVRADLCDEAIRLARVARDADARRAREPAGLLALMLLQHSRREARTGRAGRPRAARGPGPGAVGPRR